MRIFIDTANIEDIRRGAALGVIAGVSTIPSLVAASIRHPRHVTEAALAGARVATVPLKVLFQSLRHPLTDLGIERVLADAKSYTAV